MGQVGVLVCDCISVRLHERADDLGKQRRQIDAVAVFVFAN